MTAYVYHNEFSTTAQLLSIKDDASFTVTELRITYLNNDITEKHYTTHSGNFKDLLPTSFSYEKIPNDGTGSLASTSTYLYLNCASGKCIKQIDYREGTVPSQGEIRGYPYYHPKVIIGIILERDDQTLIDRSKKALIHLIKICGGKQETF